MGNLQEYEVEKRYREGGNESWGQGESSHQHIKKITRTLKQAGYLHQENKISRAFWNEDGILNLDWELGYTDMCI